MTWRSSRNSATKGWAASSSPTGRARSGRRSPRSCPPSEGCSTPAPERTTWRAPRSGPRRRSRARRQRRGRPGRGRAGGGRTGQARPHDRTMGPRRPCPLPPVRTAGPPPRHRPGSPPCPCRRPRPSSGGRRGAIVRPRCRTPRPASARLPEGPRPGDSISPDGDRKVGAPGAQRPRRNPRRAGRRRAGIAARRGPVPPCARPPLRKSRA